MAVMLDLDFTLIDSSSIAHLRQTHQQQTVYQMIPQIPVYEGIHELLQTLKAHDIQIAIVTSSRKTFCDRLIAHHNWPIDHLITRQDVHQPKPHPAGIHLALQKLNITPQQAIMIGDHPHDIQAAQAAQVYSIGALWGSQTSAELIATQPDRLCATVTELQNFLLEDAHLAHSKFGANLQPLDDWFAIKPQ
jgi:HAD superfamily hydrolase (TIGR01509 family)